jgi:hypothetical protein
MANSPYGSMKRILQADEAILDAAFTAHTVRHSCEEGGVPLKAWTLRLG